MTEQLSSDRDQPADAPPEGAGAPRVQVTPDAVAFCLKRRLELGKPLAALRIGVKGGGCEGLTYVTDFTTDPPRKRDIIYDFDGLPVYVDERSLKYIEGSEIYYHNTLMYHGLKFRNPLEASACGCGETFSVKS